MHEENQALMVVLSHLTSRYPFMINELLKLWELIDTNIINIRARYIRSVANVWADKLSRETNKDDLQLNPHIFTYLDSVWGPHCIDRFATHGNKQLPCYNARRRNPSAEAMDCLYPRDRLWTSETNWCNPLWTLLPDLIQELRQFGAEATVIAPYESAKQLYQLLSELSDEQIVYPLPRFIFSGQARSVQGRLAAGWSVTAVHVPYRLGSIDRGTLNPAPTARTSAPIPRHVRTSADNEYPAALVKCRLIEPSARAPWHASMRNHVGALLGTDDMGDLVLDLFTGPLAPTTYNNYGTGMRRFTVFCDEEGITPLHATAADMLSFIRAWLARARAVAASNPQPYFSTINKFFRDHLKEPMALGPLLTDARRGLAMQQQPITDPDIRVPIHAPIVQQMLHFAHRHYRALPWQPDTLVHIKTFRAIFAIYTN
jgi:hypothetical protein